MINGVTVTGASASIKTISGNTINNCSQFGISLLSVKKVQNVLSNTISNCAKGAVCVAKSKCNSLSNNTITGVKKYEFRDHFRENQSEKDFKEYN